MKLKEIIHLKKTEPDKFWSAFHEHVLEDYKNPSSDFAASLQETFVEFYGFQKRASEASYPLHLLHIPTEIKPNELTYVIQWFAMSDRGQEFAVSNERFPITTGLIPFPDSSYYTFHLHAVGISPFSDEIDVFTPHFFSRYAERADRREADLKLPDHLHFTKQKENTAPSVKDFKNFAKFIGKFFGRNKLNHLCGNLNSVIANNEKDKNQLVCLWTDGLSFCVPYADGKVILHKTFISYAELKTSQMDAVMPELSKLIKACCEKYPSQYGSKEEFAKLLECYISKNALK